MGFVYARISYLGGGGFDDSVMSPILVFAVFLWNIFNLGYDFKGETRMRESRQILSILVPGGSGTHQSD